MKINRRTIVVTTITLAAAGGVSAFAYVSQSVNATGSGSTASYQPITATLNVPSNLAPGDAAAVTLAVHNPNKFAVTLAGLKYAVTAPGTDKCPEGSLVIDQPAAKQVAPTGDSTGIHTTIHFVDLQDVNQAGCLGERVTVTATAP